VLAQGVRADPERIYLGTVTNIRLEPGASVHTLIVEVDGDVLQFRAPEATMHGFIAELSGLVDPLSSSRAAAGRPPTLPSPSPRAGG
jgi:hypothetical protein